jgi:FAD/FMN-containing dehydrogenase
MTSSSSRKYPPPQAGKDAPIPAEPSLILDMRGFRNINYNFHEQIVTVQAGALLGELGLTLEKVGRMIPSGSCPTVGVGGQAVSGGFGLMSR